MPPIPESNFAYPVHISVGALSVGSGFYFDCKRDVYLATAKHVLFQRGLELHYKEALLTSVCNDLKTRLVLKIKCDEMQASNDVKKHDRADVAVVKIGSLNDKDILTYVKGVSRESDTPSNVGILGMAFANLRKLTEVQVGNDVILFAYPGRSLGHKGQIDQTRPLLRHGMIAGKTEDNRIVVDCPVYFGNSGGLVVEVDVSELGKWKYRGIGVATEMVPFVEELWSKQFKSHVGTRFENSGYALVEPMDRILELV